MRLYNQTSCTPIASSSSMKPKTPLWTSTTSTASFVASADRVRAIGGKETQENSKPNHSKDRGIPKSAEEKISEHSTSNLGCLGTAVQPISEDLSIAATENQLPTTGCVERLSTAIPLTHLSPEHGTTVESRDDKSKEHDDPMIASQAGIEIPILPSLNEDSGTNSFVLHQKSSCSEDLIIDASLVIYQDKDPGLSSLSLATEPSRDEEHENSDFPTLLSTESSGDSLWHYFASPEKENPFHGTNALGEKIVSSRARDFAPFQPITEAECEPVQPCNPGVQVKRPSSSCFLFPSTQSLTKSPPSHYSMKRRGDYEVRTAESQVQNITSSSSADIGAATNRDKSIKLAPSKRDSSIFMDTISMNEISKSSVKKTSATVAKVGTGTQFSHGQNLYQAAPSWDVSKYTIMLKSGFAVSCVKKAMERDGVDSSIIDLLTLASSSFPAGEQTLSRTSTVSQRGKARMRLRRNGHACMIL